MGTPLHHKWSRSGATRCSSVPRLRQEWPWLFLMNVIHPSTNNSCSASLSHLPNLAIFVGPRLLSIVLGDLLVFHGGFGGSGGLITWLLSFLPVCQALACFAR